MKPLEAVSVLDLTEGNPYIGSVFADYGATVLQVESHRAAMISGAGEEHRRKKDHMHSTICAARRVLQLITQQQTVRRS